jgi:hypothetical protein
MNRETLDKINELINQLERVNSVLKQEGIHWVTVKRTDENCYGTECFQGSIELEYKLVEPLVKAQQEELISKLKDLGYEE